MSSFYPNSALPTLEYDDIIESPPPEKDPHFSVNSQLPSPKIPHSDSDSDSTPKSFFPISEDIPSSQLHYDDASNSDDETSRMIPSRPPSEANRAIRTLLDPPTSNLSVITGYLYLTCLLTGSGLLALPYAFHLVGFLPGLFGIIILGLLAYSTGMFLFQMTHPPRQRYQLEPKTLPSYLAIATVCFGEKASWITTGFLFVGQLGIVSTYLIFISQMFHKLFPSLDIVVCLIIVSVIAYILCLIRNLETFSKSIYFAAFGIIGSLLCIFVDSLIRGSSSGRPAENQFLHTDISYIFPFLGIVTFSFCSHTLIIPFSNRFEDSSQFPVVFRFSMISTVFLQLLFGLLFNNFANSENPQVLITENTHHPGLKIALEWVLSLVLIGLIPFQLWSIIEISENAYCVPRRTKFSFNSFSDLISKLFQLFDSSFESIDSWKRNFIRLSMVVIAALFAGIFPYFCVMTALFGSFSTTVIVFILPSLFYLRLNHIKDLDERLELSMEKIPLDYIDAALALGFPGLKSNHKSIYLAYLILTLGCFLLVSGLFVDIEDLAFDIQHNV